MAQKLLAKRKLKAYPRKEADLVPLPSPAEVVIRISLATSKIISITDEKGQLFADEPLDEANIIEYGMHVEKMPPIAHISSVYCERKPTGCIIITRPDGSQFLLW